MLEHVEPDQPGQFITDRQIVYIGPVGEVDEQVMIVHGQGGGVVIVVGASSMPQDVASRIAEQCLALIPSERKMVLDAISNTLRPISGFRHIHPPEAVTSDEGPDTRPPATGAEAGAGA